MRFLIYYFLFLFFILSIFISGVLDSQDSFQYVAVARNIYYKGKPIAPAKKYEELENIHMSTFVGKDGRTYSPTGLGFTLAFLPAVAVTDIFYKIYGITPVEKFPLENDWLILLTTSFINAFFGAMLGTILYKYLRELGLLHKQALFISFISIFATNLFALSKHTFAHMMFIVFTLLSFLMIKIFSKTLKTKYLFFSGLFFGIMLITYNQTGILSILPLVIYYWLLFKLKINFSNMRLFIKHSLYFIIGLIPFILIYYWYENLRAWEYANLGYLISNRMTAPLTIIIEGIYGQLFSPGRSIFIYSPIILIIVFFWFKIRKSVLPEFIIFLVFSVIYIIFFSLQSSYGGIDMGYAGLWHGESSWGPRYLSPLLPFALLIIGDIFLQLRNKARIFFFYPLLIMGIYINLLGILMPYQDKFHKLQRDFWVNNDNFPVYTYSNFIPRYSAPLQMSKELIKNLLSYPLTLYHGSYNVRFYDGIGVPFNVGSERWRSIEGKGYISFDLNKNPKIEKITLGFINHPLSEASRSAAILNFNLNGKDLNQTVKIAASERTLVSIPISSEALKEKDNQFVIHVNFDDPRVLKKNSQILGLISFYLNNKVVNMNSLDFPYVSALGPKMIGVTYNTYGGTITNPWRFWELHTLVYEQTPDFWWFRSLYYWDMPKKTILTLFIINVFLATYFGIKVFKTKTEN